MTIPQKQTAQEFRIAATKLISEFFQRNYVMPKELHCGRDTWMELKCDYYCELPSMFGWHPDGSITFMGLKVIPDYKGEPNKLEVK